MRILFVVLVFLVLSSLILVNNNNLKISLKEDREVLFEKYLSWVGDFASNVKTLTGDVVRFDWLPE